MEEIEKNFVTLRCMLSGDGEVEPNVDQVLQLATEVCKEDVLTLLVHKLPILGWEVSYYNFLDIFMHLDYVFSLDDVYVICLNRQERI